MDDGREGAPVLRPPPRRRRFSPLTRRILAINLIALLIPIGGLLYLGDYKQSLFEAEMEAMNGQAKVLAATLAFGAVALVGTQGEERLMRGSAEQLLRPILRTMRIRARIFDLEGELVLDSWSFGAQAGQVESESLPPPGILNWSDRLLDAYDGLIDRLSPHHAMETYRESAMQHARDYGEVLGALNGGTESMIRATSDGVVILTAAVPISRYKQVAGALLLSRDGGAIEESVRRVRSNVLGLFIVALAVLVMLSVYLGWAIAQPIRRLSAAAERVRFLYGSRQVRPAGSAMERPERLLPDFGRRGDEIGDLSRALRDMTEALSGRIDAIERFAADVAHEIKNPLSSLRSAVETLERVSDSDRRGQLLEIINEDVRRLDRLITDISDASRLDAQLSRAAVEPVDLRRLLMALVEAHVAAGARPPMSLSVDPALGEGAVVLPGVADRLGQVMRNLIANARSFSGPDGRIALRLESRRVPGGRVAVVLVDDDGPGFPEGTLEKAFERFYSERPQGEKFGEHSGLGLSISRQIVEAHGGSLHAENRVDATGRVVGARLVLLLPMD